MPRTTPETGETFRPSTRDEWRAWLQQHGAEKQEVWLLLYNKRSPVHGMGYNEAVEEALCFGWVDGQARSVDNGTYGVRFTPRRPGSVWAQSNIERVERLMREGRMTEAGLAPVREAQRNGQWDRATQRENVADLPTDLADALGAAGTSRAAFDALPLSHRKQYLAWIDEARRPQTRTRRIAETVRRVQDPTGGAAG